MSKTDPYFSFSGMPFQTSGDDVEASLNLKKAMDHVRAYVMGGGTQSEAMKALGYLGALRATVLSRSVMIRSRLISRISIDLGDIGILGSPKPWRRG